MKSVVISCVKCAAHRHISMQAPEESASRLGSENWCDIISFYWLYFVLGFVKAVLAWPFSVIHLVVSCTCITIACTFWNIPRTWSTLCCRLGRDSSIPMRVLIIAITPFLFLSFILVALFVSFADATRTAFYFPFVATFDTNDYLLWSGFSQAWVENIRISKVCANFHTAIIGDCLDELVQHLSETDRWQCPGCCKYVWAGIAGVLYGAIATTLLVLVHILPLLCKTWIEIVLFYVETSVFESTSMCIAWRIVQFIPFVFALFPLTPLFVVTVAAVTWTCGLFIGWSAIYYAYVEGCGWKGLKSLHTQQIAFWHHKAIEYNFTRWSC